MLTTSAHKFRKSLLQMVTSAVIVVALLPNALPWTTSAQLPIDAGPSLHLQPSAPENSSVLYDGTLNPGTPDTQGFFYLVNPPSSIQATQMFVTPVTVLDTTPQMSDYAGYFAKPTLYAPLDRASGYQILFTVQVMTETHISSDRAGFSLLVVSSDKRGIELGFWIDEIWAQEGGSSQPFTHAEGAAITTTSDLIDYRLIVLGERYTLTANGTTVLSGPLRDYTLAPPPPLPANPYNMPNLIFLGDDTSSAQAKIKFRYAAVINTPPFIIYLPVILKD
jgi:hypothetical protein